MAAAVFDNNRVTDNNNNNNNTATLPLIGNTTFGVVGGGAIFIDGGVVIAARCSYFDNFVDIGGDGGAVLAVEASIRLEEIEFDDNAANLNGGAVAVHRSIVQLASAIFKQCTARGGNGQALYIGDDRDETIDGSYVYCDPVLAVSFCFGFDDGQAIYELPGGNFSNTNCQEVGLSDVFSEQCPNF